MYWLRDVLTPILLAFSLDYLLDPLVDRLEAWKVPRPAGIALVLTGTLGAVALFLGLVVPGIAADVAGMIRELRQQLAALWARLTPWLAQRGIDVPHSAAEWTERLSTYASDVASAILAPAGNALGSLLGATLGVLGSVAAALVVLVLAVYLLNAADRRPYGGAVGGLGAGGAVRRRRALRLLGRALSGAGDAVAKIFVASAVHYYRRTALFRDVPPAVAGPDGHAAGHGGLADARPREL